MSGDNAGMNLFIAFMGQWHDWAIFVYDHDRLKESES